jgi:hypothetical protein
MATQAPRPLKAGSTPASSRASTPPTAPSSGPAEPRTHATLFYVPFEDIGHDVPTQLTPIRAGDDESSSIRHLVWVDTAMLVAVVGREAVALITVAVA